MRLDRASRIRLIKRQIAFVACKLETIPSRRDAGDMGVSAAENRVKKELEEHFDAKFSFSSGAYQLRLVGVHASCTSGLQGLLTNWQRVARKRIEKIRGEAA